MRMATPRPRSKPGSVAASTTASHRSPSPAPDVQRLGATGIGPGCSSRRHEDVGAGHEGHVGAAATDAYAVTVDARGEDRGGAAECSCWCNRNPRPYEQPDQRTSGGSWD